MPLLALDPLINMRQAWNERSFTDKRMMIVLPAQGFELTGLDRQALLIGVADAAKGCRAGRVERAGIKLRIRAFLASGRPAAARPLANPRLEAFRKIGILVARDHVSHAMQTDVIDTLHPQLVTAAVAYVQACVGMRAAGRTDASELSSLIAGPACLTPANDAENRSLAIAQAV
ncbi:hypothetical protein [Sphingomonas oryzagri]